MGLGAAVVRLHGHGQGMGLGAAVVRLIVPHQGSAVHRHDLLPS